MTITIQNIQAIKAQILSMASQENMDNAHLEYMACLTEGRKVNSEIDQLSDLGAILEQVKELASKIEQANPTYTIDIDAERDARRELGL